MTENSRSAPSSWTDEVRIFSGQLGQVSSLFSLSGGVGMISSWVTESAPCRIDVPMQSDPVSPPPITTTCLPPARIGTSSLRLSRHAAVLLGQEIHREMHALEVAALDWQITGLLGAAGQDHGIMLIDQRVDGDIVAHMNAADGR